MGGFYYTHVFVLCYLIPAILVLRKPHKWGGLLLVLLLSWIGYLIHWFALGRTLAGA